MRDVRTLRQHQILNWQPWSDNRNVISTPFIDIALRRQWTPEEREGAKQQEINNNKTVGRWLDGASPHTISLQRARDYNGGHFSMAPVPRHIRNWVLDLAQNGLRYFAQEAHLPQRKCASNITLLYGAKDNVKLFRCRSWVWRTDRLKPYSADRSISIKSKAYTDFQKLNAPTLMKVNREVDLCCAGASW